MNPHVLNRDFQHPPDGWYQIEALGHHPNPAAGVVQVIDAEAAHNIVHRFNAAAVAGQLRHGHELLIDHEHFSEQPDQETRAYGWLQELRSRDDGIYGRIRWTGTGRAAVDGGDYRFFSTEYEPSDLVAVDVNPRLTNANPQQTSKTKAVRPTRLAGLTLTNMNNNRGQKPITNRDPVGVQALACPTGNTLKRELQPDFAGSREPVDSNPPTLRSGAAGKTNKVKVENKQMKTVCTLLGLSPEAEEASVHAAVSKLLNRAEITPDALTSLTQRAITLAAQNQALLAEQLDSLLAEHKITDEKVINRLKPVLDGLKNREERLACLADLGFKVGGPSSSLSSSSSSHARVLNRGTGTLPTSDHSLVGRDEAAIAQKLKNRANELHVNGRSFDSAWQQASQEILSVKN